MYRHFQLQKDQPYKAQWLLHMYYMLKRTKTLHLLGVCVSYGTHKKKKYSVRFSKQH
jgi:hypothetical protein